jgi:hypothetical protein
LVAAERQGIEEMQLAERIGGCRLAQVLQIVLIHCQDQIESAEIGGFDTPGALIRDIDSVIGRNGNRTPIRTLALMPAAGTGRIDFELCRAARLACQMFEYAFGKGRPADIAGADEKNPVTIHVIVQPLELFSFSSNAKTLHPFVYTQFRTENRYALFPELL